MKVLHVFKTYLPETTGGIERVIFSIAEATAELGVRSDVLTLSGATGDDPVPVGTHLVHRAARDLDIASTGLSLSVFGRYRELARSADLIHYHFPWPMMDLLHLSLPARRPSIVTYHSDIVRQRLLRFAYAPLMHAFLRRVDRIVATSPQYFATSPVLQRYRDKVSVIPIGIPSTGPADPAVVERLRAQLGEGFFLFVGVLRYYKGLPFLLEAARRTGLRVVIAGDGEMHAELAADCPSSVTLLGAVSDAEKAALFELAGAFVFPSHLRSEAFGVSLLEAAQAGRPLISCEIGTATGWINQHGETGLVVPPADPEALAAVMRELAADPARAARMGEAARRRHAELFSAARMGDAYVAEYRRLLAGEPQPGSQGLDTARLT